MPDDIPEGLLQALLLPMVNELLPIVGNDRNAAVDAAQAATMSFNPQTVNEFRLAARVALHNIMGNRLTAEAGKPGLTPACSIRMHRCALAYIKEADKAERHLEKLQAARGKEQTQQPEPPAAPKSVQAKPATPPAKDKAAQPEPATTPAATAISPPRPAIPAYKLLKQQRRLAKRQARDARLAAAAQTQPETPDLPLAA